VFIFVVKYRWEPSDFAHMLIRCQVAFFRATLVADLAPGKRGYSNYFYLLFLAFVTDVNFDKFRAGMGNLFTITGRVNCALSLAGRKINWFYPKILPLSNYGEEWLLLTCHQSTCLSWSFLLTRWYHNLGNENYIAGHIKGSRRPHLARDLQVPHPWFRVKTFFKFTELSCFVLKHGFLSWVPWNPKGSMNVISKASICSDIRNG